MQPDETVQGLIFNIQYYCIHDGPGIRTTVFLKGCPLRCPWCQNPESQAFGPEILFYREKCTGCGTCVLTCPNGSIEIQEGLSVTNRQLCQGEGNCAAVCPHDARTLAGSRVTAAEVCKKVLADKIFYQRSGGGLTLSGGEPLAQPEFSAAILRLCKDAGIHTVLETTGYARWEIMRPVLEHVDLVLYDFKHMDPERHRELTGVSNELILTNVKRIFQELKIPLVARIPVIPGCNDSAANMEATAQFVAEELSVLIPVHLLPYHSLGQSKSERLERTETGFSAEPPNDEHKLALQRIFESYNLQVQIGG